MTALLLLAMTVLAAPSPDFDNDGEVGFSDFLVFASKFGTVAGQANYDAVCDLDEDGEIGFPDFILFAQQFGTKTDDKKDDEKDEELSVVPGVTVIPGRIRYLFITARCVGKVTFTINNVKYETQGSIWQRKVGNSWQDIASTNNKTQICGYSPTSRGEYRIIIFVKVNNEIRRYTAENTLTVR